MSGPLTGFRVIDLTSMISGPICTRILGDQGADVIKVEPLTGDLVRHMGPNRNGLTATFITSNRNKRSVALNLKDERGKDILKKLIKGADVFVQNFRPGAIERMGFGEAAVREIQDNIVYVSISGFGETGPYAHKRVYDPVIQALSGLATIQADRETGRPKMVRTIVPDKLTAMTAAQAITSALLARERSGKGEHVKLAMLDAMVAFLWPEGMTDQTFVGKQIKNSRARLAQDLIFKTKDGYITAGAVSDSEWEGMAKALEHPEWLEDERFSTANGRVVHVVPRLKMMADAIETFTSEECLNRLEAHDVPCAPVLERHEIATHPQVIENQLVIEHEHPQAGVIREPRPAAHFIHTGSTALQEAPMLGEHNDEILGELGFSSAELEAFREGGVLAASG